MNSFVRNIMIILIYSHYPQSYQQLFAFIFYICGIFSHYPQVM